MFNASKSDKLRIGVLMGGINIEREVSFNSGRTICDHIDASNYHIIPIFQTENGELYLLPWRFLHRGKISDFRHRLAREATHITWDDLKKHVDFIYIAMHGRYAEDGTLQGMLEVLGIPYLGAKVFGSALGMDKAMHKQMLEAHGIRVPRGFVVKKHEALTITQDELFARFTQVQLSFPCIIKPTHEGSSLGISVAYDIPQLYAAVLHAHAIDDYQAQDVLVEEKVEGMEFVCVSLQNISNEWFSLPLTEIVPEKNTAFFDYEQKYMLGRVAKITPARCSTQDATAIVQTCQTVAQLLHFTNMARIDGILTTAGEVVILDPNSLTGMGPTTFLFHQAAQFGMNHTQLINYLIEHELISYGLMQPEQKNKAQKEDESMLTQKIKVAVLFGGASNEREISLESGRNICYKLSPHKYEVIPLFVNDRMELFKLSPELLIKNTTQVIAESITPDLQVSWSQLPTLCDFVFIGLHGGKGENGAVQGTLEMLGLPYNGSGVLASALCMDKYAANEFLQSKGFDVPRSMFIEKTLWESKNKEEQETFVHELTKQLPLPLIIKPHDDGCSVFVQKITTEQEIINAINSLIEHGKSGALIEEFVKGIELTCGVYGNQTATAFPPSQAVTQSGVLSMTEKFLPGAGENLTPAPIGEQAIRFVQQTLESAFLAIGCSGYARIDCFYQPAKQSPTGKERLIILEFNTLPALTPATCTFHQAAEVGMKPMDFFDLVVELGLENHKKKKSRTLFEQHALQ